MGQQNPATKQADSGPEKSLPVLLGAEPVRSQELQAEIDRISQSDIFDVAQRDRTLFAWLSSQRDARLNGFVISGCYADLRKSCRFYQRLYVQKRGHLYTVPAPVIYVEVTQYGTPTDLYRNILRELGNPFAEVGRLANLRTRTWGTLKSYDVRLLVLGKADYLSYKAFNELIELTRNLKIAIVPVGTPYLNDILTRKTRRYADIANTFLERHDFPPFRKADTAGIIKQWEAQVLKEWSQPLKLYEDEQAVSFLHMRSGGHGEALYDMLRKVAILKLDNPSLNLDVNELAKILDSRDVPANKW
ncbi:AAA family ATPase [Leptothoe spongobia]|uniref:AAA family ATPase n=1 Tax=Leptothoe spongobia TAU-MAC 1115 TaxID=1967444 RepID=A0A947DDL7_9CYAN|nr:AAA family ATPase [Leptothoe spongobia]MBT9315112.1 AAA family ATPase [Leptothoe spongobia TAU-MAC 1115]